MPGAQTAGEGPAIYRPRSLSADGQRLFFTSGDALVNVQRMCSEAMARLAWRLWLPST